jgi:hypothetical protein
MTVIKSFFQDGTSNFSMMRLLSFIITVTVMLIWAVECLRKNEFLGWGDSQVYVLIACIVPTVIQKLVESGGLQFLFGNKKGD